MVHDVEDEKVIQLVIAALEKGIDVEMDNLIDKILEIIDEASKIGEKALEIEREESLTITLSALYITMFRRIAEKYGLKIASRVAASFIDFIFSSREKVLSSLKYVEYIMEKVEREYIDKNKIDKE